MKPLPKENSIVMPDVPSFTERHFHHFQRCAGHTSSGETLLYEADNNPELLQ